MNKKLMILVVVFTLLLSVGCSKDKVEKVDDKDAITEIEKETDIEEEQENEEVVKEEVPVVEEEDSTNYTDGTLYSELDILNQDIFEVAELFYSEESGDMQREIFALAEEHGSEINFSAISGNSKNKLLGLLGESSREQLKPVFEKGYGIVIVDSMYYPIIDYVELDKKYENSISDNLADYLEIRSSELKNPIIVEEYLSVSASELAKRAMIYERFLAENEDFKYASEINNSLMIMIWKLVSPSATDGTIDEDGNVKIDLMQSYGNIANSTDTPVLTEVIKPLIKFINENDGVLSEDVQNELSDLSYSLHEQAANRLVELYNIK